MVVFEFTVADLARMRFAISPAWELVTSLRVLRNRAPAEPPPAGVREALPVAAGLDLALAFALLPPEGYIPDFVSPPPRKPVPVLADELREVEATPADAVRADVTTLLRGRKVPPALAPLIADPPRVLPELTARMREYWDKTLARYWPRIRALLDADLTHRAGRLTDGGPSRLFADLGEGVEFRDGRLSVPTMYDETLPLRGQGLLLVPSAFVWRPFAVTTPPWQPTLIYRRAGSRCCGRGASRAARARRRAGERAGECRPRGARVDHGAGGPPRPQRRWHLGPPHRAARRGPGLRGAPGPLGPLRPHARRRPPHRP